MKSVDTGDADIANLWLYLKTNSKKSLDAINLENYGRNSTLIMYTMQVQPYKW